MSVCLFVLAKTYLVVQQGKAGHAKWVCYVCKTQCPDLKTMKVHFESKHPKETMDETKFVDTHAVYGATTVGVAVHGTLKNAKKKNKDGTDAEEE